MRVTDALDQHARERPDALAAVDATTRLDWSGLRGRVDAVAAALCAQGLVVGDRVALIASDGVPALVAALAVLRAGGVHAPLDHSLAAPEIAAAVAALRAPWTLRLDDVGAPSLESTGQERGADPLGAGESAYVRCSSGTTGTAKGVVLSHRTIRDRVAAADRGLRLTADDRVLWLLPMAYHFAVSILLYVQRGAAVVFGNALRASTTAASARTHACTFAYASPYHIRRLADLPSGHDLPPTLRRVVATTTALDATAAADFRARHGLGVQQGLGIIEVGLALLSPGAPGECPGDFGPPLPDYRVAILDPAGDSVPPGITGELAIAGPGLLDAYLDPWRPQGAVLHRGFFRTGDLAVLDATGGVRLLGRSKDVINVGGVKVFPCEVESVLAAHPAIAACRVAARPDDRTGEQIHAELVLRGNADAVPADFAAWCAERLAPLKRPAAITVVAELPMTGSGKVRRG